jgi:hypothetical protein
MRRTVRLGVVATLAGLLLVPAVLVGIGPPWSLFGTATAVRTGQAPNPWAVRLTSQGFATFGGIDYTNPSGPMKFDDLYYFGTDFAVVAFTGIGCGGGSPRFQLNIDTDGNGSFNGNVFVYIGMPPSFSPCDTVPPGEWQTTGNFVGTPPTELRYDTSQIGGTFYDSYDGTRIKLNTLYPNHQILGIQLVVDGGWSQPGDTQTIDVDKVIVNQHILIARGYAKP